MIKRNESGLPRYPASSAERVPWLEAMREVVGEQKWHGVEEQVQAFLTWTDGVERQPEEIMEKIEEITAPLDDIEARIVRVLVIDSLFRRSLRGQGKHGRSR